MNVRGRRTHTHTIPFLHTHGAIQTNKCDEYFIRIKFTAPCIYVNTIPACYFCHCLAIALKYNNVDGYIQ